MSSEERSEPIDLKRRSQLDRHRYLERKAREELASNRPDMALAILDLAILDQEPDERLSELLALIESHRRNVWPPKQYPSLDRVGRIDDRRLYEAAERIRAGLPSSEYSPPNDPADAGR